MIVEIDRIALKWTSISTFVLAIKIFITMFYMGHSRVLSGGRPPEDVLLFPTAGPQSFDGSCRLDKKDNPKYELRKQNEIRWSRIMMNDLENIPIALILSWGGLLSAHSPRIHTLLVIGFTLARIMHTICYANKIVYMRTMSWTLGVICFLGLGLNNVIGTI